MTTWLPVAILLASLGLMTLLPLLPATIELWRKSDAMPLNVVQQHAGEIRHFANGFRTYIKGLKPILQECAASGTTATGQLPDGAEYLVLGPVDEAALLRLLPHGGSCPWVIAAAGSLTTPSNISFGNDIYVGAQLRGGEKNQYRAILAEDDVHLGTSSQVLRWVHAVGELNAQRGCKLHGRVSSDRAIRLQPDCTFARLNAPRIEIGESAGHGTPADFDRPSPALTVRHLLEQDFEVKPGEVFSGDLVVRGRLLIRSGACLYGSVKSTKDLLLEEGVLIAGSLISGRRMEIGPNCAIHGPVLAERELVIRRGVQCGSPQRSTTVSSPEIEVEPGVVVFGTLWARERGKVGDSA